LVWEGELDEQLLPTLQREGIRELELNDCNGWIPGPLDILSSLDGALDALSILRFGSLERIDPVHMLSRLLKLKIVSGSTGMKDELDLTAFPHLHGLALEWNKRYVGLTEIARPDLNMLYLGCYRRSDSFSNFPNLQHLMMKEVNFPNLEFLRGLHDLRTFWVGANRRFQDLSGIGVHANLEWLIIDGCSQIQNGWEEVGRLANLRDFSIENVGEVSTLTFLEGCRSLETLGIWGNTNILDGDFTFIDRLPGLRQLKIKPVKRHYTGCTEIDDPNYKRTPFPIQPEQWP